MLKESRLAVIWRDVLGQKYVGLDDHFYSVGGHPVLIATLRQRIAAELGQEIPAAELIQNPTVRMQAELVQRHVDNASALPTGVLALQNSGSPNKTFWALPLNENLAELIGDNRSVFSVSLTDADVLSLGEAPTLEGIAACLLRKILTMQPEGPYTIGGLCLGGILAYEIAFQLQAAGREVSLLCCWIRRTPHTWNRGPHRSLRRRTCAT